MHEYHILLLLNMISGISQKKIFTILWKTIKNYDVSRIAIWKIDIMKKNIMNMQSISLTIVTNSCDI